MINNKLRIWLAQEISGCFSSLPVLRGKARQQNKLSRQFAIRSQVSFHLLVWFPNFCTWWQKTTQMLRWASITFIVFYNSFTVYKIKLYVSSIRPNVRILSSEVDAQRSFLDYTGGEVLKETRMQKRKRADSGGEDQHGDTSELNIGNNTWVSCNWVCITNIYIYFLNYLCNNSI